MMKKFTSNGFLTSMIILGFIATFAILLPALVVGDSDTSYTGLQVAFGHEFSNLGEWVSGEIKFSFIVVLAYLLPLIGSLLIMFTKKGYLYATFIFFLAAILLFLTPQFTVTTVTVLGNVNEIDIEWTYGIGLIIATALCVAGAMVGMVRMSKQG